ncbi:MAG: carboxy-S-adenosyl-L-methionine synthase CmoA [Gammaproteobacteria bacterium]|nr:carboxy-S-adenosyl-L-methionine synthase CmoA [Gammaproteobacteria bacterium]
MSNDTLYAKPQPYLVDFNFDEKVTAVFPDMIRRSVPGYANIIAMLGLFAEEYSQTDSRLYDLGCSLGAATLSMRHHIQAKNCQIIAVDNSSAMVERCRENLESDLATTPVELICDDILSVAISNASVVVLNFTLQFISPETRLALLQKIHQGMLPGGVLVLSEKIAFNDPVEQQHQEEMHLAFKRANGYSELEISQKRTALENVLVPDTLEQHKSRLSAAGFSHSDVWFQCFNFASLVAHK